MKKVLALVLASTMAFGMAATGFAASYNAGFKAPSADPFRSGVTLQDGYGGAYVASDITNAVIGVSSWKSMNVNTPRNLSNQTVTYTSDIRPYEKAEDFINLYTTMFNGPQYYRTDSKGYLINAANATTTVLASSKTQAELWEMQKNGEAVIEARLLSAADIRTSKLAVRTSVAKGSKVFEDVTIDNKVGAVKIKYIKEWVNTGDLDFDFTVYLTVDGRRYTNEGLTFVGTMANEVTTVYKDDDYVDTSSGQVAEAEDFVSKIEVDLGNGVSIFTKFFKGKKYYGTATRDADDAADIVFSKYADVDNVVILKTVGLNSTGDIVKLDTDYSDYYVYDKDLNYLGQSNEMLPYSTRYYLANKKLDVTANDNDTDVSDDEPSDESGENPNMGGDDGIADNANANPGTGR